MTKHEQDHLSPANPYLSQSGAEPVPAGTATTVDHCQFQYRHQCLHVCLAKHRGHTQPSDGNGVDMGSTMRKARVVYHGPTGTATYEGLPPKVPQRRPRRRTKHPTHRTNRCCRVCHAVNLANDNYGEENLFSVATIITKPTPWEMKSKYGQDNIDPEPEPYIPSFRGSVISHKRTRPSKGRLMVQLIDNSTGGWSNSGEGW